MRLNQRVASTTAWAGGAASMAALVYAGLVAITWLGYGRVKVPAAGERDGLLDRFMPVYEVVVRHQGYVAAPPDITLAAAKDHDLFGPALVRAIVSTRELVMRVCPEDRERPRTLTALMQSFGWGVLADVPGQEIVFGSVTRPWEGNVRFDAVPAAGFAAFAEPGFVKIVWNLRVDAAEGGGSVFRVETRVTTTDPVSRAKFRRYWAFVSPGSVLIRRISFGPIKREAERRARQGGS